MCFDLQVFKVKHGRHTKAILEKHHTNSTVLGLGQVDMNYDILVRFELGSPITFLGSDRVRQTYTERYIVYPSSTLGNTNGHKWMEKSGLVLHHPSIQQSF